MASGYCWKDNKVINLKTWWSLIFGKLKTLYLPYVICNGLFLLLRNVFVSLNVYSDNPLFLELTQSAVYQQQLIQKLSFTGFARETMRVLLGIGTTQLGSATWFLIALFLVIAIHAVLTLLIKNCKHKNIVYLVAFCCLALATIFVNKTELRGELRRIPCTYMAFLMGYFAKKYNIKKYCNRWGVAILAFITLVFLSNIGSIEMSAARIQNPLFFIVTSYAGWILLYYLATLVIKLRSVKTVFEYVGKHTMPILCLHLLAFKAVSLLYVCFTKQPMCLLASFHIIFDVPPIYKVLYTVIGVIAPLFIYYVWKKISVKFTPCVLISN